MHSRLRHLLLSIICAACCLRVSGQEAASAGMKLRFMPVIANRPLVLDDEAGHTPDDSLRITMLRCYISGISLLQNSTEVWAEPQSYHLLDAEQPQTLTLLIRAPAGLVYNTLRFNLGIDSATSASGAHGGELDPARGMYWAWQSGYINFKLEGKSVVCHTRNNAFQFHLGGYQMPYAAMRQVDLPVHPATELVVRIDLDQFLSHIDLARQNAVMIPGDEAVVLSEKAALIFHAQQ